MRFISGRHTHQKKGYLEEAGLFEYPLRNVCLCNLVLHLYLIGYYAYNSQLIEMRNDI